MEVVADHVVHTPLVRSCAFLGRRWVGTANRKSPESYCTPPTGGVSQAQYNSRRA